MLCRYRADDGTIISRVFGEDEHVPAAINIPTAPIEAMTADEAIERFCTRGETVVPRYEAKTFLRMDSAP